jgi:hypothetical protein
VKGQEVLQLHKSFTQVSLQSLALLTCRQVLTCDPSPSLISSTGHKERMSSLQALANRVSSL